MIIQCRKCGTRFKFDESLVTGDGVWVRCSRCQEVFFQENPDHEKLGSLRNAAPLQELPAGKETGGQGPGEAATVRTGLPDGIRERDVEPVLSRVREVQEILADEENLGRGFKEFDGDGEPLPERGAGDVKGPAPESGGRKARGKSVLGRLLAYSFLFILFVVLMGVFYFWAVPQDRQSVVKFLAGYFPIIERAGKDRGVPDEAAARVALKDIRQHFVNNWLMGNLRVVEGAAVNTTKYALTRLQVRGRLYDASGNIIGESASFSGNLVTGAELAVLTEEEIRKKLSRPSGTDIAVDRIGPGEQVPFVIVFVHDPPGVDKVTVMVAGAERLLQ